MTRLRCRRGERAVIAYSVRTCRIGIDGPLRAYGAEDVTRGGGP
jgi:hypothetical protein